MPTNDERGIVSKLKLTALANKIKAAAGESGSFTLDELAALNISGGSGEIIYLSAVFDAGTNKIFTTDTLDDLKQYLTVVVTVEGSTISAYPLSDDAYTLSGTLDAGSNTITVEWLNKTATFTVSGVIAATDITPALTAFPSLSNTSAIVNSSDKAICVDSVTNGSWRCVQTALNTYEGNYTYLMRVHVDYFNGDPHFGFRGDADSMIVSQSINKTSGDYECKMSLSENRSGRVTLFSTWSTSESGTAVFSNLKIIKYQEVAS